MPPSNGKHPDRIGDESEAHIIARLLDAGYDVLLPFGKNHSYDLVIEDTEGQFWKVQCKTGRLDEEGTVVTFYTSSSYNHTVKHKGRRNYLGQVDYFAVYCPDNAEVFLLPVDAVPAMVAKLRVLPAKNGQEKNIRWACDYKL